MFRSNPPYAIWSIWIYLPFLQKLLFLVACLVSIYSILSAAVVVGRLRTISSQPQNEDIPSFQRAVAALHKRCTNVQQLIGATFYLFGVVLFVGFQGAYNSVGKSTDPGWFIIDNFVIYFAFAANLFLIFFLIHCIQWFVSGRVHACASRLSAPRLT
ncbi:MAG: hypothetical protein WAK13_13415 [Terriglobales bacterium]